MTPDYKPSRYMHIICAKCGAYNDAITFTIEIPTKAERDVGDTESVTLRCQNCGTLDDLTNSIAQGFPFKDRPLAKP